MQDEFIIQPRLLIRMASFNVKKKHSQTSSEKLMTLTMKPPAPPPGKYHMRLIAREDIVGRWDSPAYRWVFQVEGIEHHGSQISRTTGTELKQQESLAKLICSLYGKQFEIGALIDLDELLGRLFLVTIGTTKSGSRCIEAIAPAECMSQIN
jgi:hypothetical protein